MSSSFRNWLSWLQPQRKSCLRCGHVIIHRNQNKAAWIDKSLYYTLCSTCMGSIPWITAVQCLRCGRAQVCGDCRYRKEDVLRCNRSAVRYTEQIKQWLRDYKFLGDERYRELLSAMMLHVYEQVTLQLLRDQGMLEQWRSSRLRITEFAKRYSVWHAVTAVPISEERLLERGFNQAEQLATSIAGRRHIPYLELLSRERDSSKLSVQKKWERVSNVSQLYSSEPSSWQPLLRQMDFSRYNNNSPNYSNYKPSFNILLVDDVYTTGSTIHACANILMKNAPMNINIYSLTWARA